MTKVEASSLHRCLPFCWMLVMTRPSAVISDLCTDVKRSIKSERKGKLAQGKGLAVRCHSHTHTPGHTHTYMQ